MSADDGRIPSAVRKDVERLAQFYRSSKPGITRMVVGQDDFDRLSEATPSTLKRNGFSVRDRRVFWSEFELVRK